MFITSELHNKVARKPTNLLLVGGIATSLCLVKLYFFNSHIANIGVFLGKTKNICKKIVKLTIFSKLHTIYICNFT